MAAIGTSSAPRVLVAVSPAGSDRLSRILGAWRSDFAATSGEALALLARHRYDSIVIGVHFDESSSLQVLEEILAASPPCPVVCVRAAAFSQPLAEHTFAAFSAACSALGACEVLDLLRFPDDDAGNTRVRDMLARLLR